MEIDGIFGLVRKPNLFPNLNFYNDYYFKYYCCNTYDNNHIVVVKLFNYLGNMISYEKELNMDNKLHNYLKITGILNDVFKPQKYS